MEETQVGEKIYFEHKYGWGWGFRRFRVSAIGIGGIIGGRNVPVEER